MAILAATPSQKKKWGADQNEGEDRKWGETIKTRQICSSIDMQI